MPFTDEQKEELWKKLDPGFIQRLNGNGYITAFHSKHEANRIFGPDGWDYTTESLELVFEDAPTFKEVKSKNGEVYTERNWKVCYRALVLVRIRAGKDLLEIKDVGFGDSQQPSRAKAHDTAGKEAVTDAVKRALSTRGMALGLALYDKTNSYIGIDEQSEPETPPATQQRPPTSGAVDDARKRAEKWVAAFISNLSGMIYAEGLDAVRAENAAFLKLRKNYRDLADEIDAAVKALPEDHAAPKQSKRFGRVNGEAHDGH